MSTYPPEKFTGPDLWATVKQYTGTDKATLTDCLEAFEEAGLDEGAWDGAHDLIEESGLVTMDKDCTFYEIQQTTEEARA
jgi:hypothetical protein